MFRYPASRAFDLSTTPWRWAQPVVWTFDDRGSMGPGVDIAQLTGAGFNTLPIGLGIEYVPGVTVTHF